LTGWYQLLGAIALIGLGGVFAAIDAAISTVSLARVHELVRDERPGAVSLLKVMVERPRYINLVVLLRIVCEITATVLLVVFLYDNFGLTWALSARRPSWCSRASSSSAWARVPWAARRRIPSRWRQPFRCR